MKPQENTIMYAQDLYAQRDDRFHVRTNKELKRILVEHCKVNNLDLSKILNDTLIWVACKKGIISAPFKQPGKQKLEDWWDEKDNPKQNSTRIK